MASEALAQALVLDVGEGLLGRHGDGVAGVDAHGIDVLDGADDDHVVLEVAHDLQLELLPADDALSRSTWWVGEASRPAPNYGVDS